MLSKQIFLDFDFSMPRFLCRKFDCERMNDLKKNMYLKFYLPVRTVCGERIIALGGCGLGQYTVY